MVLIESQNQQRLTEFDTRNTEQLVSTLTDLERDRLAKTIGIDASLFEGQEQLFDEILARGLQAQSSAIDFSIASRAEDKEFSRDLLIERERRASEEALALRLGRRQSRDQLSQSLIGGFGDILGGFLSGR